MMPSTPVRRRLRARALDFLPLPLALLAALGIALATRNPAAMLIGAVVLYQPQVVPTLRDHSTLWLMARQMARIAVLGLLLFLLPMVTTAAGAPLIPPVPGTRVLVIACAALLVYAVLFATLRALLHRGHFATRIVVVGPPAAVAGVATRLRQHHHNLFHVLGVFDENETAEVDQLLQLGQREWLDAIVVARHSIEDRCPDALRHQLRHLSAPIAVVAPSGKEGAWLVVDDLDLAMFTQLAAAFGEEKYGFVVTPNADHLVRLHEDAAFRRSYASADFVLLDSRFLAHWLRWTRRQCLRVCPGSDLTTALFDEVIGSMDRVVIIGGTAVQAEQLRTRYALRNLHQLVPPMGFIRDPAAVDACLDFIEQHSPFRFCLLAVGAPQQERLAELLKERGQARGLALCVGASLNFLTGEERRAPSWMRRCGVEWLYRLLQDPRRLAARYLWRGPRVFGVMAHSAIVTRKRLFTVPAAGPDARPHRTGSVVPATQRRTG